MARKNEARKNAGITIGSNVPKQWTLEAVSELHATVAEHAKQRSAAQKIKNEMMAVQFEIENYLNDNTMQPVTLEDAVGNYLSVLNLSFRKFALCIETTDSNLKKYLSGDRKFNIDLAMKFSSFFHTPAELWLQLQLKNELQKLSKEKRRTKRYQKYDYRKAIDVLE